jgi:hypothetical protein
LSRSLISFEIYDQFFGGKPKFSSLSGDFVLMD